MSNVKTRRARADDLAAVEALVTAAYTPWVKVIRVVPGPMRDDYSQTIADGVMHLVDDESGMVAMLVLRPLKSSMLLENVAVHPRAQGRGIGRSLIAEAERATRAAGLERVILYTHARMASNIALYKRAGFVVVEERHEQGLDRIYMEKTLG